MAKRNGHEPGWSAGAERLARSAARAVTAPAAQMIANPNSMYRAESSIDRPPRLTRTPAMNSTGTQ